MSKNIIVVLVTCYRPICGSNLSRDFGYLDGFRDSYYKEGLLPSVKIPASCFGSHGFYSQPEADFPNRGFWPSSTQGRDEECIQKFWSGNLNIKDHS
jgi:hypothetical protein